MKASAIGVVLGVLVCGCRFEIASGAASREGEGGQLDGSGGADQGAGGQGGEAGEGGEAGQGGQGGQGGAPTPAPVCGDGALDPGEGCDDGNADPGDACSPSCIPSPFPLAASVGLDLVARPDGAIAAWREGAASGPPYSIALRRFGPSGQLLTAPVFVAEGGAFGPPRAACNGSGRCLIAWADSASAIRAVIVEPDGSTSPPFTLASGHGVDLSIASSDSAVEGFAVQWLDAIGPGPFPVKLILRDHYGADSGQGTATIATQATHAGPVIRANGGWLSTWIDGSGGVMARQLDINGGGGALSPVSMGAAYTAPLAAIQYGFGFLAALLTPAGSIALREYGALINPPGDAGSIAIESSAVGDAPAILPDAGAAWILYAGTSGIEARHVEPAAQVEAPAVLVPGVQARAIRAAALPGGGVMLAWGSPAQAAILPRGVGAP